MRGNHFKKETKNPLSSMHKIITTVVLICILTLIIVDIYLLSQAILNPNPEPAHLQSLSNSLLS